MLFFIVLAPGLRASLNDCLAGVFLNHCDLPELKYFQNGAHRSSALFVCL